MSNLKEKNPPSVCESVDVKSFDLSKIKEELKKTQVNSETSISIAKCKIDILIDKFSSWQIKEIDLISFFIELLKSGKKDILSIISSEYVAKNQLDREVLIPIDFHEVKKWENLYRILVNFFWWDTLDNSRASLAVINEHKDFIHPWDKILFYSNRVVILSPNWKSKVINFPENASKPQFAKPKIENSTPVTDWQNKNVQPKLTDTKPKNVDSPKPSTKEDISFIPNNSLLDVEWKYAVKPWDNMSKIFLKFFWWSEISRSYFEEYVLKSDNWINKLWIIRPWQKINILWVYKSLSVYKEKLDILQRFWASFWDKKLSEVLSREVLKSVKISTSTKEEFESKVKEIYSFLSVLTSVFWSTDYFEEIISNISNIIDYKSYYWLKDKEVLSDIESTIKLIGSFNNDVIKWITKKNIFFTMIILREYNSIKPKHIPIEIVISLVFLESKFNKNKKSPTWSTWLFQTTSWVVKDIIERPELFDKDLIDKMLERNWLTSVKDLLPSNVRLNPYISATLWIAFFKMLEDNAKSVSIKEIWDIRKNLWNIRDSLKSFLSESKISFDENLFQQVISEIEKDKTFYTSLTRYNSDEGVYKYSRWENMPHRIYFAIIVLYLSKTLSWDLKKGKN